MTARLAGLQHIPSLNILERGSLALTLFAVRRATGVGDDRSERTRGRLPVIDLVTRIATPEQIKKAGNCYKKINQTSNSKITEQHGMLFILHYSVTELFNTFQNQSRSHCTYFLDMTM